MNDHLEISYADLREASDDLVSDVVKELATNSDIPMMLKPMLTVMLSSPAVSDGKLGMLFADKLWARLQDVV